MMSSFFILAQQYSSSDGGAAVAWAPLFALLCCMLLPVIALLTLWIWALIDCAMRRFDGNDKLIWILVILLANWVGALIYIFVGRSKAVRKSKDVVTQRSD